MSTLGLILSPVSAIRLTAKHVYVFLFFVCFCFLLKMRDPFLILTFQDDHTSVVRENQIGTLNYMAPEAIQADPSVMKEMGK